MMTWGSQPAQCKTTSLKTTDGSSQEYLCVLSHNTLLDKWPLFWRTTVSSATVKWEPQNSSRSWKGLPHHFRILHSTRSLPSTLTASPPPSVVLAGQLSPGLCVSLTIISSPLSSNPYRTLYTTCSDAGPRPPKTLSWTLGDFRSTASKSTHSQLSLETSLSLFALVEPGSPLTLIPLKPFQEVAFSLIDPYNQGAWKYGRCPPCFALLHQTFLSSSSIKSQLSHPCHQVRPLYCWCFLHHSPLHFPSINWRF